MKPSVLLVGLLDCTIKAVCEYYSLSFVKSFVPYVNSLGSYANEHSHTLKYAAHW